MLAIVILEQKAKMTEFKPDYQQLFHQSSMPRMVVCCQIADDGEFRIVDANKAAADYFNFEDGHFKGQKLCHYTDCANSDHIVQALNVCKQSKTPISIQVLPKIPGEIHVQAFLLNPVLDDEGGVTCVDMQARPPANDQVAIERERDDAISMFTTVFDLSEVGITVVDHHGRFVRINEAFTRQTGWQTIDLIGEKITKINAPENYEAAWKRHKDSLENKRHDFGEVPIVRADGSIMYMMITSVMLELSNGRSFRVTTCVDITELKKAKDAADEGNKAKSAFLANMSHELRTPLNAIIGFSEMMINGTLGKIENEHYVDYLGDIKFSAQHLLQIINDVLDMSKIEAGKMPLDEEDIDLKGLLDSVMRLMSARATQEHVTLVDIIPEDLPRVSLDERLIRQVFLNIMSNAIKFSSENSEVSVKAQIEDNGLIVSIIDTGIGIQDSRLSEIMEPFGQVNDPKLNKGQGTGLGLPIAKAMMEMHGGSLDVDSEVDKGTVVRCIFPSERLVIKNNEI